MVCMLSFRKRNPRKSNENDKSRFGWTEFDAPPKMTVYQLYTMTQPFEKCNSSAMWTRWENNIGKFDISGLGEICEGAGRPQSPAGQSTMQGKAPCCAEGRTSRLNRNSENEFFGKFLKRY